MKFDFRNRAPVFYKSGQSGFVTEAERRSESEERLRIPELSSGFFPHFWLTEADFTSVLYDKNGAYIDSCASAANADVNGAVPLLFRAEVEGAGNYRVTVEIDNSDGDDDEILIFLMRRRLYAREKLRAGEIFVRSYDVNVCEFIPRGYKTEFDGSSIDISVVAEKPRLTSLEIQKLTGENAVPTVWIAGDSTLTDQSCTYPYVPSTSYSGWGQMFSAFLRPGIAVSNHAHSGLTTHTFRAAGHHAIVMRHIKKGDFFFMQFAHNDQKTDFLTAEGGYRDKLIEYVNEVRAVGAYPVIVTPLARNSWRGDGEYNDLLFDYDRACKRVGAEYGVPVVGLHDFMLEKITSEGLESAKRYYYPGDFTHTNDPGAYMCAMFIARELAKLTSEGYEKLASFVDTSKAEWQALAGVKPPSPPVDFKAAETPNPTSDFDGNATLTRAEACDVLIKAAHFFTVNVYNDMFTDILGHEWYAGAVECAYQNGIIPCELAKKGGEFRPDEKVTLGDFAVMSVLAYASRNKLPDDESCAIDAKCEALRLKYIGFAHKLGIVDSDDELSSEVTKARASQIVKTMGI